MTPEVLLSAEVEKRVQSVAKMFASDRFDYDDLIQELRLELFRHCQDSEPLALVYLKCWSKAYRHWKKAETYAGHIAPLLIAEQEPIEDALDVMLSDFLRAIRDVEEEVSHREELEIIEKILMDLPVKQERIVRLAYAGLTYAKIGRCFGFNPRAPQKAVWKRVQVIRRVIKAHPLALRLFTKKNKVILSCIGPPSLRLTGLGALCRTEFK